MRITGSTLLFVVLSNCAAVSFGFFGNVGGLLNGLFGLGSEPRKSSMLSRISGVMFSMHGQSPSPAYKPRIPSDIFDFLRDKYPLPVWHPLDEYDYVIVGGGPAGCVLASRLSEPSGTTVLLLEAGKPEALVSAAPALATHLIATDYDWGYRMERVPGICEGMEEKRCIWPRGRVLGGTSVINFMIYARGNRVDWDRIAAEGNPGWSYEEVLPYFLKSEKANLRGLEDSPHHNTEGLMSVEFINYRTPLMDAFLGAATEFGNRIVDYNNGDEVGFGPVQVQTQRGKRHSAAKAFLLPFRGRKNLHILTNARVTKINIDPATKTAKSVEYLRDKKQFRVRAKKEIIVSSGAINSPQLLMLSGIGPRSHLEELGISVIQDLPVGETMYDHMSFPGLVFLVNQTKVGLVETDAAQLGNVLRWAFKGEGPVTLPNGIEGVGYIKTKISNEIIDFPDVELLFLPGGLNSEASETFRKKLRITDEFWNKVYKPIIEADCFSISPMLVHPKSRGFLKLRSKNPFHWPMMYYDYFTDPTDMLTIIEAIKYSIALTKTEAFQKFGARLHDTHYPTCLSYEFGSDEYWECAVRTISLPLQHQVASCKMGPATDPEAVVDHELRVHGVKRLRVADTSVIPRALTAHTNAPSVMIGEKLADILKSTWN